VADRRKEETKLQRAIIDAIELQGAYVERINSGKVKVRGGWMHGLKEGSPDLRGYIAPTGRAYYLEVKLPGEKPKPEQLAWKATHEKRGALHAFVTSVPDAVAVMSGWSFAERDASRRCG
jgi:hypothetical protein